MIPLDWTGYFEVPDRVRTSTVVELAYLITENKRPAPNPSQPNLLPGEAEVVVNFSSQIGMACQVIEMKGKRLMLVVRRDESTGKRYIREDHWPEHTWEQLERFRKSIESEAK